MYISRLAFVLAALSAASCIDKDVDNTEFYEKYASQTENLFFDGFPHKIYALSE